ncbi:hypothetical protein [Thaumasiovibrio sp. DFM-14]|uniref:hypothetical protein n=1 Tax=Thaumasiovibrio sp. DFM-14 TaxID=3384792 RepID=UPI0039A30CDD
MQKRHLITLLATGIVLAGCQSTSQPQSRLQTETTGNSSGYEYGKPAEQFTDADIELPAYYSTRGIDKCTFEVNNEHPECPLSKKVLRLYMTDPTTADGDNPNDWLSTVRAYDNSQLLNQFENQIVGLNRFRIVSGDERAMNILGDISQDMSDAELAHRMKNGVLHPDYAMTIDTVKMGELVQAGSSNLVDFGLDFTIGFLDPYTREKISYPNVGRIKVRTQDVKAMSEMQFWMQSGKIEGGFDFFDANAVSSVFNDMSARGFGIALSRMLSEMPATAQVLGIRGDRISLDRGQNAGILPEETMVVFEYSYGFAEPIGVATVNPSDIESQGRIIRWKDSRDAKRIQGESKDGIYRPAADAKLFAVSVGTPKSFLQNRISASGTL